MWTLQNTKNKDRTETKNKKKNKFRRACEYFSFLSPPFSPPFHFLLHQSVKTPYSNAHWFSRRTSSSSSGVKSFGMLNVLRISSGVFPLIMLATVRHVRSSSGLMLR